MKLGSSDWIHVCQTSPSSLTHSTAQETKECLRRRCLSSVKNDKTSSTHSCLFLTRITRMNFNPAVQLSYENAECIQVEQTCTEKKRATAHERRTNRLAPCNLPKKTNQNKKIGYSDRRYAVLSHSIQPRNALDKRLKQGNCTLCASMVTLTSTEKTTDSLCHRPATQRIYS